jgi:ABC-type multidrug transport system ATPase subunit
VKLTVNDISKHYGNKLALNEVSFSLEPGIYGLLGPNGSGKSTLMNILTGNLRATNGTVLWNDHETSSLGKAYREVLGYVPQQQSLYPEFSASRFLFYMASLKGLSTKKAKTEVRNVLDAVELSDVASQKIKTFSGGMKQRLLIAQALLGDPSLLIMDEPTVGLDPYQRDSIRKMIVGVAAKRIVLLSTHVVSDIEWIAKEILLLKNGELIRKGTRIELVSEIEQAVKRPNTSDKPLGLEDVYLHFYGEQDEPADIL